MLTALDISHIVPAAVPPFSQRAVLWDIQVKVAVPNVFDLTVAIAPAAGVFPALLLNPSQDYHHLKDARATIPARRVQRPACPSTRAVTPGNMVVLFDDQSKNVQTITPYEIELRLIRPGHPPAVAFATHATDPLDYEAAEVRVLPPAGGPLPAALTPFAGWSIVRFHY